MWITLFLQSAVSLTGAAIPTTGLLFLSSWIRNSPLKKKKKKKGKYKDSETRELKEEDEGRTGRGEGEGERNKDRGKQIEEASGRVGGNQEEGDHSEGKEGDRKIIRDGYAFAQERERERKKKGGEGAGDRRGLSPFLHPRLRELLSSTVPLPISHADKPQSPWQRCWDWRCQLKAGSPLNILTREREVWALSRHVPPSLIHFNYKELVFLQGKALSCDPL